MPLTHGVYKMQIVILDAGLQTYYVWALTLCVRAYQTQPDGNCKHQGQLGERSVELEEHKRRLRSSNTIGNHSSYNEIPQEGIGISSARQLKSARIAQTVGRDRGKMVSVNWWHERELS